MMQFIIMIFYKLYLELSLPLYYIEFQNKPLEIVSMSTYNAKIIENKIGQLSQLKRMIGVKLVSVSPELSIKLDNCQKFLKYLKKQSKQQRLADQQITFQIQPFYQDIDELLRTCYFQYRLKRTDFEALFIKLKYSEDYQKKNRIKLQQIISFQSTKQSSILLNIKDNLLSQIRSQIQDFTIESLLQKSNQILSGMPLYSQRGKEKIKEIQQITSQISRNYNIMPFHNFTHGFGVFISFYSLWQIQQVKDLTNDFDIFFWLLACLSHDVQHQGLNTLFQVKTNSYLSVQFGKFTIMQKMHLSKTLQILTKKQSTNKLYQNLKPQQKIRARKIISRAILATDMSKHYEYFGLISQNRLKKDNLEDREVILQALVHACDIENPSLQFNSYMYWAHLVCIQFHDQTLKQKEWNVQVTQYLKFETLPYFYKNQQNFANSIVFPLWDSLQTLLPSICQKQYVKKIKRNISILNEALRRNSQPVLIHKQFQQYLIEKLQN